MQKLYLILQKLANAKIMPFEGVICGKVKVENLLLRYTLGALFKKPYDALCFYGQVIANLYIIKFDISKINYRYPK